MSIRDNFFRYLAAIILAGALFSCGGDEAAAVTMPTDAETLALISRGEGLIATNCYSCHSTDAPMNERLAPPMAGVRSHYLTDTSSLAGFTEELVRFVRFPDKSNSKMPGALRRFSLMPAMPLPEEELEAIAAYIFYTDMEAPDWFEAHQKEERQAMDARQELVAEGKSYALQTKAVLGKNLMAAISEGGAEGAVGFCNTRAIPLTDSSGQALNVRIRRVSDRPRNPDNAADSLQLEQLNAIRDELAAGEKEVFRLTEMEHEVIGYYPIMTNVMCLQCHGEKTKDISPATLSALEALYPEDQAVGYAANQLRGIWVVSMPREK
ncbi:DUF3365 domain-containing protein [Neolewinella agarilytica]|uniref:c-type heme family protein n=1 Tax=Neolewinella agarilytica TaxID=478744 RepID=UPI002354159B|nr:DUF3365 domain-containing protein [Neolewinella agarilytica]